MVAADVPPHESYTRIAHSKPYRKIEIKPRNNHPHTKCPPKPHAAIERAISFEDAEETRRRLICSLQKLSCSAQRTVIKSFTWFASCLVWLENRCCNLIQTRCRCESVDAVRSVWGQLITFKCNKYYAILALIVFGETVNKSSWYK